MNDIDTLPEIRRFYKWDLDTVGSGINRNDQAGRAVDAVYSDLVPIRRDNISEAIPFLE